MRHPSAVWRIFVTCWLIYCLHFASNTVREIYPALSLGDSFSLQVDEYAGMHDDIFEKPGYGYHINSNPGASLLAAIPYGVFSPAINTIVARVNEGRSAHGNAHPPAYDSPWENDHVFYAEAWRRGLDVKFGLAAIVMQTLLMAPVSALAVLGMFLLFRKLEVGETRAVLYSLLFAFGTPVFFRTATINHNMLLGHFAFAGLLLLWNPKQLFRWSDRTRIILAGVAGGAGVLMDYSGAVFLAGLGLLALFKFREIRTIVWYAFGALGPLCVLWWAQYVSFGNPFLPAQHWMPPTEFTTGMDGVTLPAPDLMFANLFDYRFGLFTSAPILVLSLGALWAWRRLRIPVPELVFLFGSSAVLWLFSSSVQYAHLQFNTGVRYMAPTFALLFIPAALYLMRLPVMFQGLVAVAAITQAWCMAMYRDVERGLGLLEPILHVFTGGLQLPFFTVLSRMNGQYGEYFSNGASPLPLLLLMAAILFVIWWPYLRVSEARRDTQ